MDGKEIREAYNASVDRLQVAARALEELADDVRDGSADVDAARRHRPDEFRLHDPRRR